MNGCPATSISALGIFSVIGRKRVARPPARIATGKLTKEPPSFPQNRSQSAPPPTPPCSSHAAVCYGQPRRTSGIHHRPPPPACRRLRHSSCQVRTTRQSSGCSYLQNGAFYVPSDHASTHQTSSHRLPQARLCYGSQVL